MQVAERQGGFTVWLTGLSGAGKSTIAEILVNRLRERGFRVEPLDGDVVRTHLSAGLGFSKADRDTNIQRIAWVCALLNRHDVVAVVAAISPYRKARDDARAAIGRFVEVHLDAPIDVIAQRDPKGLYRSAMAGELPGFTGVDDPYEPPLNAEVTCHTDGQETADQSATKVIAKLEQLGFLPAAESGSGRGS